LEIKDSGKFRVTFGKGSGKFRATVGKGSGKYRVTVWEKAQVNLKSLVISHTI
jgi:hypothetical protein